MTESASSSRQIPRHQRQSVAPAALHHEALEGEQVVGGLAQNDTELTLGVRLHSHGQKEKGQFTAKCDVGLVQLESPA
jgi:hypothetical protein